MIASDELNEKKDVVDRFNVQYQHLPLRNWRRLGNISWQQISEPRSELGTSPVRNNIARYWTATLGITSRGYPPQTTGSTVNMARITSLHDLMSP